MEYGANHFLRPASKLRINGRALWPKLRNVKKFFVVLTSTYSNFHKKNAKNLAHLWTSAPL